MTISAKLSFTFILVMLISVSCNQEPKTKYPNKQIIINSEDAIATARTDEKDFSGTIDSTLSLSLWASDELIKDAVAISIAPDGKIYYASANRLENSEFDIRGHKDWMTASIGFQTVEDRRNFLRETFSEQNEQGEKFLKDLNEDGTLDWKDLTVEKEQIWTISDEDNDGVAEKAQLYIEDFHDEISDLANGLEYSDGKVYITSGPDMWSSEDVDGDGIADKLESISHGYAVHIGFGAHSMSGAIRGPDGRMYWGIGDIGANVTDQDGKQWKYPNRGVIARSEVDGSGFEIYCSGVRNTHEFVFDKYGNLISEDNDGDHAGERERLVYLINGSDTGWRINWQFGKYTDPDNNDYKVWTEEKMHIPHWEGQAAYFLPTIANYVNGPTGMVYNPGTALGPDWKDHFFIAEFVGTASASPIHAFTLKPKGASFELSETKEILKGILPTGLDFGPDGALYAADWIKGWGHKDEGKIWKIDVKSGEDSDIRKETKYLIKANFSKLPEAELGTYISHQDMRVRQKAQFELAKRKEEGYKTLVSSSQKGNDQLGRIHAIWGIAQMARLESMDYAAVLLSFLNDEDDEVISQAAKMIGDIKLQKGTKLLIPLLQHKNPRVQLMTIEALGRLEAKSATNPILKVLEANNDEDLWIRHAGMIALGRIGDETSLSELVNSKSKALKTVAVVALRRMKSPKVALFLADKNPYIVTEAARAINDDFSIHEALPALAESLGKTSFGTEAYVRRAINANLRVGGEASLNRLIKYVSNPFANDEMKAEAIKTIGIFHKPSVLDRVTGRYRAEINRDINKSIAIVEPQLSSLLKSRSAKVQVATIDLISRLNITSVGSELTRMFNKINNDDVKSAVIKALNTTKAESLDKVLQSALEDKSEKVRSTAMSILPKSNLEENQAATLLGKVLSTGSINEKQTVLAALGTMTGANSISILSESFAKLKEGALPPELHLDLMEAIKYQNHIPTLNSLTSYNKAKNEGDPLGEYRETLKGGNIKKGEYFFYNDQTAQCIKCHAIWEYGGTAGPLLDGVGKRLTPELLLESMVLPSASYAQGYEVNILEMNDGSNVSGTVMEESETAIRLKIKDSIKEVLKTDIKSREKLPSSMQIMTDKMTKKEMRNLIAFLENLK